MALVSKAARAGHTEVVRWLAERGADINARNKDNKTPLHRAVEKGHTDMVRWLVQNGTDMNARGSKWLTPLDAAEHNGHIDVELFLCRTGSRFVIGSERLDRRIKSLDDANRCHWGTVRSEAA